MKTLRFDQELDLNNAKVIDYAFSFTDNTIDNKIIRLANDTYISDKGFTDFLCFVCMRNNLPFIAMDPLFIRNAIINLTNN